MRLLEKRQRITAVTSRKTPSKSKFSLTDKIFNIALVCLLIDTQTAFILKLHLFLLFSQPPFVLSRLHFDTATADLILDILCLDVLQL